MVKENNIGCPISIDRKVDPYNFQNIGNKNKIFWINALHRLYFMVIKVFFVKIIFGYLINIWKKGKFRACKNAKFKETSPLPGVTKLFSTIAYTSHINEKNQNLIFVFYIKKYVKSVFIQILGIKLCENQPFWRY